MDKNEETQEQKLNRSHRYFAVNCFNNIWNILDKKPADRTESDIENALHLAHTSFYHWSNVEEHTPENISIGYWMLSRVYSVANKGEEAVFYAKKCLDVSTENKLSAFCNGYAYEALARALFLLNQPENGLDMLGKAETFLDLIEEKEDRSLLEEDIKSLK